MDQVREELVQIIKRVNLGTYDGNDEVMMALVSKVEFYVIDKDDVDFEKCVDLIQDDENVDEILRQVFEGKVKGAQASTADQKERPNASSNVLPSVQIIANDKKEESKLIDIDGLPNGVKRENGEEALSDMFSALLKDDQVREEIEKVMRNAYRYNDDDDLMMDIRDKIRPYMMKIPNFDFDKFIELIQNNNVLDIFKRVWEENFKEGKGASIFGQKERLNPSNNHEQMITSNKKEGLLNGISMVPKEEKKGNGEILYNISSVPLKNEKQNEITIIIRVSNPEFYEKLNKKKDDGTGYNFNLIMQNALNHINQMKKNGSVKTYFETKDGEKQLFLFRIFEANKLESGAGKGIELLPDTFEYRLLPQTIEVIAKTDNESLLLKPQTKINVQLESEDYCGESEDINSEKEKLYFRRFKCFLRFFQGKPYSLINGNSLEVATKKTIAKFNGIEPFMANFKKKMSLFSSKCYSTPKGILLFGPPGTGKSAITKSLCEELGVVFATAPMAAGDLKKGIVGDSEKTINEIAMRCKLVPWEMCVVLIDEIDSLAPDRTAENASTGSQDLIGVLLATLDGSKETKNMKIIASTNLLDKIDKAFLRRMEIQLFLGNPNKSSREAWIKAKIKQSQKDVNFERIRRFAEDEEFEELRNFVIYSTMNFSADAYRKLLDRFYHALLIFEPEPEPRSEYESESGSQYEGSDEYENSQLQREPEYEDYKSLLEKKILGVSEEMKIYLKGAPVLSVIKASERLCYDDYYLEVLEDIAETGGFTDLYGRKLKASCKALIDLSTEKYKQRKSEEDNFQEVVQVPCKNETRLTSEEQEVLLQLKKGLNKQDKSRAASYYLFAILYFSEVEHLEENQTKYNIVRERVLKDPTVEIFTKLCSGNSIKTHLLDNPNSQVAKDCVAKVLALARGVNEQPHVLLEDFIQSVDLFYDPMPLKILQLLKDPKRYHHDWLPLIVKFALNYDADIVKMIDNNFIVNSSALDDSAATSLISTVVSETTKYAKSVIIFDLDSISQIKKEYQSLKQDIEVSTKIAIERGDNEASFSYPLQRPQTFQTILDIFRKVDSDSKCWFFAVSKHPKIVFDFKQALKWPPTPSVTKFDQEEIDKEKLYRCKHCPEIFNERQNLNEYKCYRHTKQIVLFDDPKKPVGSTKKPQQMTLNDAYEKINKEQDIFEMNFRYVCCGTVLGGKGHEPHKHEKGEEIDLD